MRRPRGCAERRRARRESLPSRPRVPRAGKVPERGAGAFDLLGPEAVVQAAESRLGGLRLDGTVSVYPSYVNRVYGLRGEDGRELVAKFYRPGRWGRAAILEE